MTFPSLDICWSLAEAEAAHAGFSEIGLAHFWVGVCKAVELPVAVLLKAGSAELQAMEGQVEADFLEVREAFSSTGLSPMALRRAIRAEIGRKSGKFARPLHRSPALREIFKQGVSLASADGGRLRPGHLLVALVAQWEPMVSSAVTKLGKDPEKALRGLSGHLVDGFDVNRPEEEISPVAVEKKEKKDKQESVLRRFGRDLTELAALGALPPLIGRREELLKITQILLQSRKNNLILIGEPGVGKTGIVEGFAQLLAEGKLPDALGRPAVVEISLTSLVAGTKYRGEFEERLQAVVREASCEPKPILFIDEIHLLLGAGQAGGSMDAANILKPALARGTIRVIGATTIREYRQSIEKDGAGRADPARSAHFPAEWRCEWVVYGTRKKCSEPWRSPAPFTLGGSQGGARPPSPTVAQDEAALRAAVEWSIRYLHVGSDDIARAVAACCGIPVGTLTADEGVRRLARAGLKKPGRPVGVFLFVGPSGTGKTELAKALAESLFHDERRLLRFDMSEFMEEHSVAKLIGSPPGYVGYDEGGQLTDQIRTHPYSVVLFDEIEKAHPRVLDLFLQIFDEGTLTDAQGRKCDFRESVIILTSNLGAGDRPATPFIGFASGDEPEVSPDEAIAQRAQDAIRRHLRPELVNRLTKIVHFKPLGMETAREILGKMLAALNEHLTDRGVTVELDEEAVEWILRKGFSAEYGARNLERTRDNLLGRPLAEAIFAGQASGKGTMRVSVTADGLHFQWNTSVPP